MNSLYFQSNTDLFIDAILSFASNQMCKVHFNSIKDIKELSLSVMKNLANCPKIFESKNLKTIGENCLLSNVTIQTWKKVMQPIKSLSYSVDLAICPPHNLEINKLISLSVFKTVSSWIELDDDGHRRLLMESFKRRNIFLDDTKISVVDLNSGESTIKAAIFDFVLRHMNKIRFLTISEIKNRSINAVQFVGNIHPNSLVENLQKLNETDPSSSRFERDFNSAVRFFVELANCILRSSLIESCKKSGLDAISESITHVSLNWLKLDDDGYIQLLDFSMTQENFGLNQYASISSIPCEEFAFEKKLDCLKLNSRRNFDLPIASDTPLLIELINFDNSVVSKFPSVFLCNKSVVSLIIEKLQRKDLNFPFRLFNLSNLSPELRLDTDILFSFARSYRTSHYLQFLDPSFKIKKSFFLVLVSICGSSLQHASAQLQDDTDVVLAAIQNDPGAIAFASKSKQMCPHILTKLVVFHYSPASSPLTTDHEFSDENTLIAVTNPSSDAVKSS